MKSHTVSGGDLLRQVAALLPHDQERINVAIEIAESHHERYDGTGYPYGLKAMRYPCLPALPPLQIFMTHCVPPDRTKPALHMSRQWILS